MISFTDKRLYVKGTCSAQCADPATGQLLYVDNKFQTANFQTSVTMGEIRAGLGNAIAAIIPSDSAVQVNFTAADFSLWAKAAQVGASLGYNAVVPVCQTVTATGEQLTIDASQGTPVPAYGYSNIFCYVQTVGEGSLLAQHGTPYELNDQTGAITGFTAVAGTQYKVWYFTNKATAQVARLSSNFDPKVVNFTAQIAVYSNEGSKTNNGTRVGWLYAIVPYLKFGGNANLTGDATNPDTTELSGQAVAYDADTISAECSDCNASTLAYYIYVPDDGAEAITGLAVIGGTVSVNAGNTAQIPVKLVMANGELVTPSPYSLCGFKLNNAPAGTTVSPSGLVTAGTTAGDCDFEVQYPAEGDAEQTFTGQLYVKAQEPAN